MLERPRRRLLAVTTAAALAATLLPGVAAAQAPPPTRSLEVVCPDPADADFDDIAGSAHRDAIRCLADLGLTQGLRGGTSFGPRQQLTRGQMATMIAAGITAATGQPLPSAAPPFRDVPASGYVHGPAIGSLAAIGVVVGRGDGSIYDAGAPLTRGQLAAFVRRALSYIDDGNARNASAPPTSERDHYPDDDGSVFEPDIDAISAAGIVSGYRDGTFRPSHPVLRDQAATFLARSVDYALGELVDGEPQPYPAEPVDADCESLDDADCLLPFPSDRFTEPAATRTGRRIALPADQMPTSEGHPVPLTEEIVLPGIGETAIDPTEWHRNDGFSPGTPILTMVEDLDLQATFGLGDDEQVVERPSLSLAEDAPIVLLDLDTGDRVPYLAELDHHPGAVRADTQLLIIRPLVALTPGHRYGVALRDLVDEAGETIEAGDTFAWYRDRPATAAGADEGSRVADVERLLGHLAAAGVERDDLYLAWDFTVASSENLTGRARSIRDRAFGVLGDRDLADREIDGDAPGFVITGVQQDVSEDTARRVEGRLQVPNFLHPQPGETPTAATPGTWALESLLGQTTAQFAYSGSSPAPDATPLRANTDVSVPFICNVPTTASADDPSAPLMYGHGLLGTKREGNGGSTVRLRERNFTVCSIDWAGMSEFDLPVVFGILREVTGAKVMADRLQQAHLNFAFLGRALVHPDGFASHPAFQDGDGASLIDLDAPLSYDGNSQGGIMGGATVALSPDVHRGVLGVPAMNYSTLLNRSHAFETRELGAVFNANYTDPIERQLTLGLLQMLWDRGENQGYAHATTSDPLPNTPPHQILMHVAYGDYLVTPLAAEVQGRTYGARLLQTSLAPGRHWSDDPTFGFEVFDVDGDGDIVPHEGSALVYFDSGNSTPPSVNLPPTFAGEADPHEDPRRDHSGADQRRTFLLTGVVEDVRDGQPYWTIECRGPHNPFACAD